MTDAQTVAKARSVLVVIGGLMAIAGITSALIFTMPSLNDSLALSDPPISMSWQELIEKGLDDTSYLEVTDVPIDGPGQIVVTSAIAELENSGTLTGRFRPLDGDRYQFEPAGNVLNRGDAIQWLGISSVAIVVGLVICGAGGPSLLCCVFWPLPAVISFLGYPMRYRRGTRLTRIAYAVIGCALIGSGYTELFSEGQFGRVTSVISICAFGYLQITFGAAALLAAIVTSILHRMEPTTEPGMATKIVQSKLTFDKVCGKERSDAMTSRKYIERQIRTIDAGSLPQSVVEVADQFSTLGFSAIEPIQWRESRGTLTAAIQLGCHDIVVAETSVVEGMTRTRLVSLLQDGLAVITMAPGACGAATKRFGTAGFYSLSETRDPETMLALHLKQTINMAEKRGSEVVSLNAAEMTNVIGLTNRVMAQIQTQYGEVCVEVGEATYGRFRYPSRPIAQLATT